MLWYGSGAPKIKIGISMKIGFPLCKRSLGACKFIIRSKWGEKTNRKQDTELIIYSIWVRVCQEFPLMEHLILLNHVSCGSKIFNTKNQHSDSAALLQPTMTIAVYFIPVVTQQSLEYHFGTILTWFYLNLNSFRID